VTHSDPEISDAMISVRGVSKSFRKKSSIISTLRFWRPKQQIAALADVNIDLARGELVTLVGPNGAGKSTLLKIISTLIQPDSGTVFVDGKDVLKNPEDVKARIGYVLADERSFYWRLSCRENLRFFGSLQGLTSKWLEERIEVSSAMFGLGEYLDKEFMNLSTGQRQRLALARGLIADPPIVLFDEATRSLDPGRAERMRWIVKDLLVKTQGKSVLFASHDMEEVRAISDRSILMVNGSIASVGPFEQIEDRVREAFAEEARKETEEFTKLLETHGIVFDSEGGNS